MDFAEHMNLSSTLNRRLRKQKGLFVKPSDCKIEQTLRESIEWM